MYRNTLAGVLTATALLASLAGAQQAPAPRTGPFNFIYVLTPKAGMTKQLEDGMKRHAAWHTQQKDQRGYSVSVVTAGDGVGQYRVVYGGLTLADQDAATPLMAGDLADVGTNIAPYLESMTSLVSTRNDSLSRIARTEPGKAMNSVTYVYLRQGKGAEYAEYLRRLKEAHEKAGSPFRYFVLNVAIGANLPALAIVRPMDKWADMTPAGNRAVLVQAFGQPEADRLLNVIDDAVLRQVSFVSAGRPDLGYTPAGR